MYISCMATNGSSIASRLLLALASIIIFFGIIEIVVRAIGVDTRFQNRFFVLNRALDYPEVFEKDRRLFWKFRPDQTIQSDFFEGRTYHINSSGFRGPSIPDVKTKPRIVGMGNSCTFGWGVAYDSTYLARLQVLLDNHYDVINAAVPGYTSFQGLRLLQTRLLSFEPDIITILFAWNDHWAAAGGIPDADQKFPPEIILNLQNFFSQFHIYRLLKKALLSTVEPSPDSLFDRTNIVYRVGPEDFRKNLTAMVRIADSAGIWPILLTSPIPSLETYYSPGARSAMHEFHARYNEIIRDVARETSAGLVDLAAAFDRYSGLWDDARIDPIHFNARGHAVAAELIAAYIRDSRSLPSEH